jgi:hypothetical protein
MNTVPTLKKVRTRLLELGVPYVRYSKKSRLWTYWNDYTADGLAVWAMDTEKPQTEDEDAKEHKSAGQQGGSDEDTDLAEQPDATRSNKKEPDDIDTTRWAPSPDPPADKNPPAAVSTLAEQGRANVEEAYRRSDAPPTTQSPRC